MTPAWKHDDLMHDLAGHLRVSSDRIVWENMQLGPAGSMRPDLWSIKPSYVRPIPLAHEIKVSVGDLRSDLTSGKWQKYLETAAGVYFAVPAGLANKRDMPPECGLIVRGETWRVVRAPHLGVVDLPKALLLKLVIDGVGRQQRTTLHPRCRSEWDAAAAVRRRCGERVAQVIDDMAEAERRAEYLRTAADDELSRRRADAERKIADIFSGFQQLKEAVGLEPAADVSELGARLRQLRENAGHERYIHALENIKRFAERALAEPELWP